MLKFRSIFDEVAELIWENGNLSMHGLSGLQPTSDEKPTLNKAQDTLESIVQQGCQHKIQKSKYILKENAPTSVSSIDASSSGKDNDTTLMTWNSLESRRSIDNNAHEDSARHCGSVMP